ncbi:hypothetical protein SOVF_017910 [Spinacia oleracea]|nr:hypothetical protein SOVF_017910 [Spinacia oleracea]
MDSPIQEAISQLISLLSLADYARTKRYLSIIESRIEEVELVKGKLDNSLKDIQILTKQLEHYKNDHGDLLLTNAELRTERADLRVRLAAADQKVQRVNLLEKQNKELSDENASLEAAKLKIKELIDKNAGLEAAELKVKELIDKNAGLEEEMEKKVKEAEKE